MNAIGLRIIVTNVILSVFLAPIFAQVHRVMDQEAINKFGEFLEPEGELIWALRNSTFERINESMYVEKIYHPEKVVMTHMIQYEDLNRKVKSGPYYAWYDDGGPRIEGEYRDNLKEGIWNYYENGQSNLSSFGEYIADMREGIWQELDSFGLVRIEKMYSLGKLQGQQITYQEDGREAIIRNYQDGNLLSTSFVDTVGLESSWLGMTRPPYIESCGKPVTFGGMDNCSKMKWLESIYETIRYPESARNNGVEGQALFLIRFTEHGVVEVARTLNGLTDDIESECRRLVAKSPKFEAATQAGEAVEFTLELPMKFRLE